MNLLALTPEEFKTAALAWVGSITAVVIGLLGAALIILPKLTAVTTQIATLFELHRQNQKAITTLAIHTPPPKQLTQETTTESKPDPV